MDFRQQNNVAIASILCTHQGDTRLSHTYQPRLLVQATSICVKLLMNTVINTFYIIVDTLSVVDWDASSERQCCQSRRPVPQRWCLPEKEGTLNYLQSVVVIVQAVLIGVCYDALWR